MAMNRVFDECCPEAKLIVTLAVIGFVAGAAAGAAGATIIPGIQITNDDKPLMSMALGVFGAAMGTLSGKAAGVIARACGWGFFWKTDSPQSSTNEESFLKKEDTRINFTNQ